MNNLSTNLYNSVSYEESFELYKQCSAKAKNLDFLPPQKADNQTFYSNFLGSMIQKPTYKFCNFHGSPFLACNGAYSFFQNCNFYDCYFKDADFRYGYFNMCKFIRENKFKIEGAGFNYSSFSDIHFQKININGCSFRYMEIDRVLFDNCEIANSSFEHCNINNCTFKGMDLRNIGIRYNSFSNITFEDIIFPILDMTCNFDLLKELQKQSTNVKFSIGNNKVVSYDEALVLLQKLIPYYLETKQYFHVINILWINHDQENFSSLLPIILEYTIKNEDFETLQNICSLIVKTEMLTQPQLRELYNKIEDIIIPECLPVHIYKSYNFYINNIKNILYINPNNDPTLQLSLTTDIPCNQMSKLMPILETIEATVRELSPSLCPKFEIVHHSPYDIFVFVCGNITFLQQLAQTFYYTIGGINCLNKLFNPNHGKVSKGNEIMYDKVDSVFELQIKKCININITKRIKNHTKTVEYHINVL